MKDLWVRHEKRVRDNLIRTWVQDKRAQTGKDGLALLSLDTDLAVSTLQKIMSGDVPAAKTRYKLAAYLGYTEEELFPSKKSYSDLDLIGKEKCKAEKLLEREAKKEEKQKAS